MEVTLIPIDKLKLDINNPRFIVPSGASQEEAIQYLLEYEDVVVLANAINGYGGLLPGELVIALVEDEEYRVLEGNRRICACKLLLDPSLIPEKFAKIFPVVRSETRQNIEIIRADVVTDRVSAQPALAAKHIDGIKKWSSLSKWKYCAGAFNDGHSIDEISDVTKMSKASVETGVKNYFLMEHVVNLKSWSKEDLIRLDFQIIKPTVFMRLLSSKSRILNGTLKTAINLRHHPKTYKPISDLPPNDLNELLALLARASFIDKTVNTRSIIDDISGISELLLQLKIIESTDRTVTTKDTPVLGSQPIDKPEEVTHEHNADKMHPSKEMPDQTQTAPITYITEKGPDINKRTTFLPQQTTFSAKDPKLDALMNEMKSLKLTTPISCGIVLRTFLDLSLRKYCLDYNINTEKNKSLKNIFVDVVANLQQQEVMIPGVEVKRELIRLKNDIEKSKEILTINDMNSLVHSTYWKASGDRIRNTWDNFSLFFRILYRAIEQKNTGQA